MMRTHERRGRWPRSDSWSWPAACRRPPASAADWSDTAISWRYGQRFREPFNPADIKKNIFALTHASGYKYGTNYFNVDLLQSDSNDPAR